MSTAEKFSELSPQERAIWAKSGDPMGHGLLAHMLDVAAVVEVLLTHEPPSTIKHFSVLFGLPEAAFKRYIGALAGLHDFGKAIAGFQAKWEAGAEMDQQAGLAFPRSACAITDHALATAALLGNGLLQASGAERGWIMHVLQAVSAHHGYHYASGEINNGRPLGEPTEWARARQQILDAYWQALAPADNPALDEMRLPAVNWLAGLTSVADWIASNPEWFALGERHDGLRDYHADAMHLAKVALQRIGWNPSAALLQKSADTQSLLAGITGRKGLSARPLQIVGDRLLQQANGPSLLLVEAPMGEGKTELAFLAHLRLQASNGHRGLYFALPTQATGNALFARALVFLHNFVAERTDVQLIHGGATMNEDVLHLRGVADSRAESLSASAWFSQRRRPLLSPYGVGTVDQALFATLNVKHHFVRLWGLSNRVVVLDEVHAYDTYTSGLIAMLLRWLKALGCSVVLMSATLPRARRDELLRAWGVADDELPTLEYPRVVLADTSGVRGEHFAARLLAPIRLHGLSETLDELAAKALELLADGGCGAVIVNTVDRAQKLFIHLREALDSDPQLLLFHARFPADERSQHEQQVLTSFGMQGERPQRALLIATQVAEQSLDIDFDFMLTDLAPVDLLLQRAGRLHRHERERPARHREARLWVAGLQARKPPELKETAWGYVYDAYILGRTWALLTREDVLQLPADIDRLVQAVYSDDALPDDLEDDARDFIEINSYGEYIARVTKERRESFNIAIDPDAEPESAYANKPRGNEEGDGIGLINRTRLGSDSITLIPVEVVDGGWCVRIGDKPFSPDEALDDSTARQLYNRQLKVSRVAVVKHFKSSELPVAFAEHALLKSFYPLPLRQGCYESLNLRLDADLGLVYEPAKSPKKEK